MISRNSTVRRWLIVVLYAIAMAWVEAAVVYYLRTIVGRIDPYQPKPLPDVGGLAGAELTREVATMIMLICVGWLAGTTWRARFGYLLIAFGIWDIFYYVFLRALTGWPHSLLNWDILFLLPLPWWGPVITPMFVATLMILFGTVSVSADPPLWPSRRSVRVSALGVVLTLWAFMFDTIRLVVQRAGTDAIRELLPTTFPWALYLAGLALTAVPLIDICLQSFGQSILRQTPQKGETHETMA